MKHITRRYLWKPSIPDLRDTYLTIPLVIEHSPKKVDLSNLITFVLDQGELGSSSANAVAHYFEYEQNKNFGVNTNNFVLSRLFLYYSVRELEGTINSDCGASIRDSLRAINHIGVCAECFWPYNIKHFNKRPPITAYKNAQAHQSLTYTRVPRILDALKFSLSSGVPFLFGFTVYSSFESASVEKKGIVPLPDLSEKVLGGHAALCVGYNDETRMFKVLNSFGDSWGDKGYCYLPYEYLTDKNLAGDFWTMSIK